MTGSNGGANRSRPRLTPEQVREIRAAHQHGARPVDLARQYGVTVAAICYRLKHGSSQAVTPGKPRRRRRDPNVPAREVTAFGNFELHPSHLITGATRVPFTGEHLRLDTRYAAALTVCDHAADAHDAATLLDALGLAIIRQRPTDLEESAS